MYVVLGFVGLRYFPLSLLCTVTLLFICDELLCSCLNLVFVLLTNLVLPIISCQVAEPQVSRLCMEAEEFIVMGKWLELASLMITSAELIFSKVSEKGRVIFLFLILV